MFSSLKEGLKKDTLQEKSHFDRLMEVKAKVDHKKHIEFEEDFHALTVLC